MRTLTPVTSPYRDLVPAAHTRAPKGGKGLPTITAPLRQEKKAPKKDRKEDGDRTQTKSGMGEESVRICATKEKKKWNSKFVLILYARLAFRVQVQV